MLFSIPIYLLRYFAKSYIYHSTSGIVSEGVGEGRGGGGGAVRVRLFRVLIQSKLL